MPIQVSSHIKKQLPENERDDIENQLWDKSGGICHLCDHPMEQLSETLVADHDQPVAENGETTLANLNLSHTGCNSFKRNHSTVDVRPYLKIVGAIKKQGGIVNYDGAIKLLELKPSPVSIKVTASRCIFTLPGGKTKTSPVMGETNRADTFTYCYVELPKEVIYNDDQCQPRTIKQQQLWAIYNDLNFNPLHEAPGCRLEEVKGKPDQFRVLMFDGQHKTLSNWIHGRDIIAVKVYLNLTRDQAIRLVNSVQAKIKKLPLSPFELSAKMSEEWRDLVDKYEEAVGTDEASEKGFISWIGAAERSRAKSAFEDALFQNILESEDLLFKKLVLQQGGKKRELSITEAAFRNKVLKRLLHIQPLEEKFEDSQGLRNRESETIVRLLNLLYNKAFEGQNGPEFTEREKLRAKRLSYQSSLNFVSGMLRSVHGHRVAATEPREILEKAGGDDIWNKIDGDIDRLLNHPVWFAEYEKSDKMRAIDVALSKNQDAGRAFRGVELKLGYVIGVDKLDPAALAD